MPTISPSATRALRLAFDETATGLYVNHSDLRALYTALGAKNARKTVQQARRVLTDPFISSVTLIATDASGAEVEVLVQVIELDHTEPAREVRTIATGWTAVTLIASVIAAVIGLFFLMWHHEGLRIALAFWFLASFGFVGLWHVWRGANRTTVTNKEDALS